MGALPLLGETLLARQDGRLGDTVLATVYFISRSPIPDEEGGFQRSGRKHGGTTTR